MRTRTTFVSAAIVLLTALAFACQISLASAAEEGKKHKKSKGSQISRSKPAMAQPGRGIQSKKAKAAEEAKKHKKSKGTQISRYTPTIAQPGGGIQSTKAKAAESSGMKKGQNCATQGPKVKKVSPDEGKTGDKVTITGERFGAPGCVTMVSFGPGSPAKFTQVDDKTLTAVVPDGKNGLELLTVTGSVGVDSKPFLRK